VAIHLYAPSYRLPTDPLLDPIFGYLNGTHAYFPQDYFDEVVQTGGWTMERSGDGCIAPWSHRPTVWRSSDRAARRAMVSELDTYRRHTVSWCSRHSRA